MFGLFPGYAQRGYSMGETPQIFKTFERNFSQLGLEYPKRGRAEGWVSPTGDPWWSQMMTYACTEFEEQLQRIQLLSTMLAVRQGVRANIKNFMGMLEQYNPETCTF